MTKRCFMCGYDKEYKEFPLDNEGKYGLGLICFDCERSVVGRDSKSIDNSDSELTNIICINGKWWDRMLTSDEMKWISDNAEMLNQLDFFPMQHKISPLKGEHENEHSRKYKPGDDDDSK